MEARRWTLGTTFSTKNMRHLPPSIAPLITPKFTPLLTQVHVATRSVPQNIGVLSPKKLVKAPFCSSHSSLGVFQLHPAPAPKAESARTLPRPRHPPASQGLQLPKKRRVSDHPPGGKGVLGGCRSGHQRCAMLCRTGSCHVSMFL